MKEEEFIKEISEVIRKYEGEVDENIIHILKRDVGIIKNYMEVKNHEV